MRRTTTPPPASITTSVSTSSTAPGAAIGAAGRPSTRPTSPPASAVPGGFGQPFGPGRRAARGDVRAAILVLLAEKPSHGYQIIQELERRSDGAWRASPGSVYPTLQQLEDEGLVRAVEADGGRRVFELTDTGREEAAKLAAGPAPWAEAAGSVGGDHRDLRDQAFQLLAAVWQVSRTGDAAHIAEAQDDPPRGAPQAVPAPCRQRVPVREDRGLTTGTCRRARPTMGHDRRTP